MLNEFNADCPLTPNKPEKWLREIIALVESCRTYVISNDMLQALLSKSQGNVVTSVFPVETFNEVFEAIKRGDTLKCVTSNAVYLVHSACYSEIADDDYRSFEFDYINEDFQRVKFGLEILAGSIRLHTKTVAAI